MGSREAILTRVEPSLKKALEKRAEDNKRSVSREVELILETAVKQPAPIATG